VEVGEAVGFGPVQPPAAVTPLGHQAGVFEECKVLADGRSRAVERRCDLTCRQLGGADQLEDRPSSRFGKSTQYGVGAVGLHGHRPTAFPSGSVTTAKDP
jgi:hypothetical protein